MPPELIDILPANYVGLIQEKLKADNVFLTESYIKEVLENKDMRTSFSCVVLQAALAVHEEQKKFLV